MKRPELPGDWMHRLTSGDRRILGRVLTLIENEGPAGAALLDALAADTVARHVVGFTGAPGVGKSRLLDAYVTVLRQRGSTVGVVAVDPSSPKSGGAVLGDRARMGRHATDAGVFVRSLAARGHRGGLTRTANRVIELLSAAAFDMLVLETVGTGQSEVEIGEIATTTVLVCAPGMGDDLQAIKAGILEIADIVVVNKADLLAAGPTQRALQDAIHRSASASGWTVPVLESTALNGSGVAELADAVARHATVVGLAEPARRRLQACLEAQVMDLAGARVSALGEDELRNLERALANGDTTVRHAALRLLREEPMV